MNTQLPYHRYLELRHFTLQYHDMQREYKKALDRRRTGEDPTGQAAMEMERYSRSIDLIDRTAIRVGVSVDYILERKCSKHDYEAFYWILDKERE